MWDFNHWAPVNDPSFFGRTQQRQALPTEANGVMLLKLDTYNPTNQPGYPPAFYGSEAISRQLFTASIAAGGIVFEARARLVNPVGGIVGGIFSYNFSTITHLHDEIDFESLTNDAVNGRNREQTNVYGNELLGSGHTQFVPVVGSLTSFHTYRMEWLPDRVRWFIDGQLVRESKDHVPQNPMALSFDIWAPASDWAEAYSSSLQPVLSPGSNTSYVFEIDYAHVARLSTIYGNGTNNNLTGTAINDWIDGHGGNDILTGGAGDDMLIGGSGSDTASYAHATGGVTVNLNKTTAQAVGGGQGSDTLTSIENLTGSSYADALTGDSGDNILTAGTGNDTLNGGAGNDTFNLGAFLTAADKIDGGAGTDRLNLSGNYSAGVTFNSSTVKNVEKIVLAAGYSYKLTTNDATVASGQTLTIDGSALGAGNVLTFNGAAETNGHFIIISGKGADKLTGGSLSDTFTYTSAAQSTSTHYDTITGFKFGVDNFDIPGGAGVITGINTKLTSGSLSTATFDANLASAISSSHLGAHHAVLFTPNSGTLSGATFLIVDLNGVAGYQTGSDLVIRMNGSSGTLAAGGFH